MTVNIRMCSKISVMTLVHLTRYLFRCRDVPNVRISVLLVRFRKFTSRDLIVCHVRREGSCRMEAAHVVVRLVLMMGIRVRADCVMLLFQELRLVSFMSIRIKLKLIIKTSFWVIGQSHYLHILRLSAATQTTMFTMVFVALVNRYLNTACRVPMLQNVPHATQVSGLKNPQMESVMCVILTIVRNVAKTIIVLNALWDMRQSMAHV